MTPLHNDGDEPLDILRGAERIGAYLGLNVRQAFHLLEKGELPAKKIGGRWMTTKHQLRRFVMEVAS
jgi:hypothetical protein